MISTGKSDSAATERFRANSEVEARLNVEVVLKLGVVAGPFVCRSVICQTKMRNVMDAYARRSSFRTSHYNARFYNITHSARWHQVLLPG